MKVAYLFSRYPVPSQTFCDTEMRALEAAGFEIEIFSCSPPTTSFRHGAEFSPSARVFYAPPGPVLKAWRADAQTRGAWPAGLVAEHEQRFGAARDPARRALHALYFADLARRRGIDHVHVHFANRATHAALFMRAMGGPPFSFTAHGQDFMVDLGSDALLEEMCERAQFVAAVSDYSCELLTRKFPRLTARVHRIYNGLEESAWPEDRTALSDGEGPLRIFSAGRLIDFKGFGDLIKACALLRERKVDFECIIAGDGPLRVSLEAMVRDAELSDRVRLAGLLSRAQLRDNMEACDVFALASRVDSSGASDVLPTVILEAMAAGRPVVSTSVAGIPELVEHNVTGLLTAPDFPGALTDALIKLTDWRTRAAMGAAGRRRFVERFTADRSANQLGKLFGLRPCANASMRAPSVLAIAGQWPPAEVPADARRLALNCRKVPDDFAEIEFLPDAMAIEGVWRTETTLAQRLESWRAEAGGSIDTEEYLAAARRALWLHAQTDPITHWHAADAEALLMCWLGSRLGGSKATCPDSLKSGALWQRLQDGFE